jgi:DNA-binding transcriptional MerR regulator
VRIASQPPIPDNTDVAEDEYTIDQLATAMRVPSRTIRFYQSKGALQPPQIRGRVAFYGPEHVERLKLIGTLQDRGLSIRAIRDLLSQADKGELALNEWLGLEQQLKEPWQSDSARVLDENQVKELLADRRPGALADLLHLGLLERQSGGFLVRSPSLLQVALRLDAAGVDFETAAGAGLILRKHLSRAAADLTEFFFKRTGEGFGRDLTAADLATAYLELRPVGLEAVRLLFAREMERSLRKLVESGATSALPAKARKRRR